jgi:uncharacterized membrane protein YphA (DoxX/SURF4 family)
MDIVLVIGRVLFALLFISSGVSHLTKLEAMTGYAQYKKVPAAKLSVVLSGLMILVGGIYIAFGVYLIPTSFLMHAFWKETDATAKQNETIGFFKNLSLAGAALIIFALVATGTDFGPSITGAFFNL